MTPGFVQAMDTAFAKGRHVILGLNTQDRYYAPELGIRPAYLPYFLAHYYTLQGYRVLQYSPAQGVTELNPSGGEDPQTEAKGMFRGLRDPLDVVNRIMGLMRDSRQRWLVLVLYADHLAPGGDAAAGRDPAEDRTLEILHQLALDDVIAAGASRLALVTYQNPPSALLLSCRGYQRVDIGLPQEEERLQFMQFLMDCSRNAPRRWAELDQGLDLERAARQTAGMTLANLEKMFVQTSEEEVVVTVEDIHQHKSTSIREMARDLLEVSEPQNGFDKTAGLHAAKDYLRLLIPQIISGRPGVPQGVLLHGVPGCGKSHLIKALAKEMSWPLCELRNIRGPYVGQSEQQLEHMIRIVEELKPVVLFVDELDQSLGQRGTGASNDGGTSERLLARLFSWLGDMHLRGSVLFVGATNRPDILDPAMIDRFGVAIPFLLPSPQDILELLPILLDNFDCRKAEGVDLNEMVGLLAKARPSVRSLQEIIIYASFLADRSGNGHGTPIGAEHLSKALRDHMPASDPLELEFLTLCSLGKCSNQALLPWNGIDGLRDPQAIPVDLVERGLVDPETGHLDRERLEQLTGEASRQRSMQRWSR
jgi:AAA+ superfamily predicted ATPase